MPTKKKTAERTRLTVTQRIEAARLGGEVTGYRQAVSDSERNQAAEKAAAPRRLFYISQNENGFELTECTAGSVRGKTWTDAAACNLGALIDSFVA